MTDNCTFSSDSLAELTSWISEQFCNNTPEESNVMLIVSERNGMGKSLCAQRLAERYSEDVKVFSWHQKHLTIDDFAQRMFKYMRKPEEQTKRVVYHFDLSREVDMGLANFLIRLCLFWICNCVKWFCVATKFK